MGKQVRLAGANPPQPWPCSPLVCAESFVFPLHMELETTMEKAYMGLVWTRKPVGGDKLTNLLNSYMHAL